MKRRVNQNKGANALLQSFTRCRLMLELKRKAMKNRTQFFTDVL